ncbi:hypothetical protein PGS49_22805 [Yersinia intermedia]|uniref:hypothetical protein n=1 Tax=Yersinia intermedia TaxID=631 RepID=UPI0022FE0BB5|nr:hypothetical protein [Yersinia intermedia]MDA5483428.1 hypothetical protein [Yersinia intermedia]
MLSTKQTQALFSSQWATWVDRYQRRLWREKNRRLRPCWMTPNGTPQLTQYVLAVSCGECEVSDIDTSAVSECVTDNPDTPGWR